MGRPFFIPQFLGDDMYNTPKQNRIELTKLVDELSKRYGDTYEMDRANPDVEALRIHLGMATFHAEHLLRQQGGRYPESD
jgi:hypothetical protein